jgi:hypothetical protein
MSYPNSIDSADDIRTATDNFLEFVKLWGGKLNEQLKGEDVSVLRGRHRTRTSL